MGMGNAFIAVADDATAASWNPGGLSQLEAPEISFAVETLSLQETMSSSSNPEARSRDTFQINDLNYASLVFPFYFKTNMVFSLNFLKLYRFDKSLQTPIIFAPRAAGDVERKFDFDLDQDGTFSIIAPAFGLDLTDRLALGFTWGIWDHSITRSSRFERTERSIGTSTFGNLENDFNFEDINEFEIMKGRSFVIGGIYRLNQFLNLGFMIKPSFTLEMNHTRTFTVNPTNPQQSPMVSETRKKSEFEFPWIVGMGFAWRPNHPWTLSIDLTWTDWSDFTFVEDDITENPITGRPRNEGRLEDTYTVRFGGEYLVIKRSYILPIRFGMGYDPAPAVDDVDDYYTINLGSGIQLGRYNLDFAYEFRWGSNVNSDNFRSIQASEDIRQHRVLASLIYYF